MTEPTDAELDELRQANSGRLNFVTLSEFRTIARAVLARWGTPAPVEWPSDSEIDALVTSIGPTEGIRKDSRDLSMSKLRMLVRRALATWGQVKEAPAAQGDALDAARYRWLRHGDNDEKVLKTYTSRPSEPGEPTMFLPRNDELDRLIDAARAAQEGK